MAQAYATVAEVLAVAPEFTDTAEATVQLWLDIAATMIGLERWGVRANFAHALLTAHFLTVGPGADGEGGSESGVVVSESNGPASRTFASPTPAPPSEAALSTSAHGRAFVSLRKITRGQTSGVVVSGPRWWSRG